MSEGRIGRVVGERYEIVERIAAGGMGVVFRAERVGLKRPVAIKFLHPWIAENPVLMRRFEVEAQAASKLTHPNTTPVIDFGVEDGAPYLVMEHVVGRPLRALIEAGPTPAARAIPIVRQILAGLGHAHKLGIVHRDVKPDNILLADEGGLVRVLDFGLAKLEGTTGVTAGFAMGTPSYMAPEQTLGEKVDARADLYAAGIVLFELVAGRKPFVGKEAMEILRMHREAAPPDLPGASPQLVAVVKKALAKRREDRWESAAAMSAALEAVPEVAAITTPVAIEEPPPPRRRLLLVAGAAALAVALAAGGWLALRPRAHPAAAAAAAPDAAPNAVLEIDPPAASDTDGATIARLLELRKKDPGDAKVVFALGHRYFARLWWQDGLSAYQTAVRLDPSLRKDPALIRDLVRALVSDGFHGRAEAFLRVEVGADALPYLDAAAAAPDGSINVRNRARALAAELRRP